MLRPLRGIGVISVEQENAAQPFGEAWEALKADRSVQFQLTPTPPEPEMPAWIEALGRFLESILRPVGRFAQWLFSWMPDAPYARIALGILLLVGVLTLVWLIADRVRHGDWSPPWRSRAAPAPTMGAAELAWLPEEASARAWIDEADALARQGRFAEAVHCLLLRSIEDMAQRWPDAVCPSSTSRELAMSEILTERARPLFTGLARLVEESLFGGRPVGESGWREARGVYTRFALPETWRR